jgi:hypothetical protein
MILVYLTYLDVQRIGMIEFATSSLVTRLFQVC